MAVRQRRHLPFVALIGLILLIALPVVTYPLGRDQGEFATIGRGLLDGKIPYVDLWNPKPPAVFYVYALAMTLFGRTISALRLIDLILFPVIAAALYTIGLRVANRHVGMWAIVLFGVFYFTETFWTLTQNDGIALLPMTLAMLCAIETARVERGSALLAAACGAMLGWTFWFKYPFALLGVPVIALYLSFRARSGGSIRTRDVIGVVLGGLVVLLGGAGLMVAIGAWDALVESAVVTSGYTSLSLDPEQFADGMRTGIYYRLLQWGLLFLLAGLALPLTIRRGWRPFQSRGLGIGVWLLAGLAIMLVQGKGYDYHWLPMLPPLAVIGAVGVVRGIDAISHRNPLRVRLHVGAAVVLLGIAAALLWSRALPYLTGQEDQAAYFSRFVAGEVSADESLRVAEFLRERVVPGDSLFIWGFRPEVYYMSHLNPAVRFIFQFPLVADWYPPEWREETVEVLWAALPPYVLVLQVDYMPWVTGSHDDSNTLLQAYPEMNDWLVYNYERETQIGNFFIWRRKS